jgi:hypothetical protein
MKESTTLAAITTQETTTNILTIESAISNTKSNKNQNKIFVPAAIAEPHETMAYPATSNAQAYTTGLQPVVNARATLPSTVIQHNSSSYKSALLKKKHSSAAQCLDSKIPITAPMVPTRNLSTLCVPKGPTKQTSEAAIPKTAKIAAAKQTTTTTTTTTTGKTSAAKSQSFNNHRTIQTLSKTSTFIIKDITLTSISKSTTLSTNQPAIAQELSTAIALKTTTTPTMHPTTTISTDQTTSAGLTQTAYTDTIPTNHETPSSKSVLSTTLPTIPSQTASTETISAENTSLLNQTTKVKYISSANITSLKLSHNHTRMYFHNVSHVHVNSAFNNPQTMSSNF